MCGRPLNGVGLDLGSSWYLLVHHSEDRDCNPQVLAI